MTKQEFIKKIKMGPVKELKIGEKYFIEAEFVDVFGRGELEFQEISDRRGRIDVWANYEKIYSEQEMKEQYENIEGAKVKYIEVESIPVEVSEYRGSVLLHNDYDYDLETRLIEIPKRKTKVKDLLNIDLTESQWQMLEEIMKPKE